MKQIQIPSLWRIAKTKTVENDHAKHEHGALPAATLESNLTFSSPYSTGNRITTKKETQLYHNQLHESIANHHRCRWPCLWHLRYVEQGGFIVLSLSITCNPPVESLA